MNYKAILKKYLNTKDVFLVVLGIAIGLFVVYKMAPKVDTKPFEEKIQQQEKLIEIKQGQIDSLDLIETKLVETVLKVNAEYADFRAKAITDKQTDSLQLEEIRKGIGKYGEPAVRPAQAALASSYGNNAFDDLALTEQRLANNQKVNVTLAEVVQHKDTIIINNQFIIKEIKKGTTKDRIKWFFGGSLLGFLLTLIFL